MVKAILFDLDDTLMAQDASDDVAFRAACARAHERAHVNPQALYDAARRHAHRAWRDAPTFAYADRIGISYTEGLWARFTGDDPGLVALRGWAPAYRREAWRAALLERGVDDVPLVEDLAATFARERRARQVVFPDAAPALRDLRANYRLGLVTNGAPDLQHEKLHASGLEHFFDAVIVSGEVGIGKPDPRIFALALGRLEARPGEAVMVGDNPARDIAGAQRAGIKAVFVERPDVRRDLGDVAPDARIASLDLLRAVVEGL